mmetsp:Transcript_32462/g.67696  ORF Transcript_32462/g.67696 Transcript_32462/m.67696 type:complete len:91 (-) Transcript_32462:259-531(-)|eukprot:CAMPEP_0172454920 /NCGR_PEP_ID=MMETSP1065-20121228/11763_1 /TAXON_ID=265537 /ORGANISM="Amphiprora paludosa, Strain CCMP125" /LENGTH=90 /DNA_ID=CAMNT_0013207331 /DNA_START=111 /DNA_END=383 /DNA_ORIENTATION=+
MFTAATSRAVTRVAARRFSTAAEPKMHKAAGNWDALKAKRPRQIDDEHLVFHGPFDPTTVYMIAGFVVFGGWGAMEFGTWHQMRKQGYRK